MCWVWNSAKETKASHWPLRGLQWSPGSPLGLRSGMSSEKPGLGGSSKRSLILSPLQRRTAKGHSQLGKPAPHSLEAPTLLFWNHGIQLKKNKASDTAQLAFKSEFFKPLDVIYNYIYILTYYWQADLRMTLSPIMGFSPEASIPVALPL